MTEEEKCYEDNYGLLDWYHEFVREFNKRLKENQKLLWHDLRKNPNDLPESDKEKMYYVTDKDGRYSLARYYCDTWSDTDIIENILAWYELPKFEE